VRKNTKGKSQVRAKAGRRAVLLPGLAGLMALLVFGCHQDMYNQPKLKLLTKSTFFADSLSSRPLVENTVIHGSLVTDSLFATGRIGGELADAFPFPVTRDVLVRGRERFAIYCSPCHGLLGDGQGIVVRRGFSPPPSYHTDRLRENTPTGRFFDVITNGFGRMFPFGSRIPVRDRWAIVAYIRTLQFSQHAPLAGLPDEIRRHVEEEE
jgi:mono/diheme cytochrome c family protein